MQDKQTLETFWDLIYQWQESCKADGETQAKATDRLESFVLKVTQ